MRASLRPLAFAALAAQLGCTVGRMHTESDGAPRAASEHALLSVQRLRKMNSQTAFDALQGMASYSSRLLRTPAPRVMLVLDGSRTRDLDTLKGIRAADLYEIRVLGDVEAAVNPGDLEVVVTTLGGHNRVR